MSETFENEPMSSSQLLPERLTKRPWGDMTIPYACLVNGQPRCIPEDEFIYTPNGVVKVENIYDGMPILGGYIKSSYSLIDDVYEMKFGSNKYYFNGEHPICVSKHQQPQKKQVNPLYHWLTVNELFDFVNNNKENHNRWYALAYKQKSFKFNTISVGKEFAKLLGYLMSDGYFSEKQSVKFTNVNKDILAEVTELSMGFAESFEFSLKTYQKGNGQDIYFTGKRGRSVSLLKERLRELGVIDRTTFGKLQMLQEDELIEFISGIFNGDGSLNDRKYPMIKFCTGIHKNIAFELQFMLWRLGIKSIIITIDPVKKRKAKQFVYDVEIYGNELKKLINILDDRKYPKKFESVKQRLQSKKKQKNMKQNDEYIFLPISRIKYVGKKKVIGWETVSSNEIICPLGLKTHNSGKTKLVDRFVDEFWQRYFTVIWIWCGGGYESLFLTINKNCKTRWKAIITKDPKRANELPACQCDDIIPVVWLVPYYFEIIQETLDRFNGVYWNSWEEYNEAYLSGNSLVDSWLPPTVDVTKLKKPAKLRPFPKIKVVRIHPPIGDSNPKEFRDEIYEAVKLSKNEHRVILHVGECYTPDHKGKVERYSTVAGIMDYIYDELAESDLFERATGDRTKLTKKQKGQHKIAIIATEFKKICPPTEFMPDKEATISRRAWYSFISEKRHKKTWVVADCQADRDIYAKVRMQFSELKIFKRTTLSLIGDESKDFYNSVNKQCDNIYESWGFNPKRVPLHAKLRLLNERNMCRIPELPDDRMIIKLETNEHMLRKVKHARFHHKDDKQDDFFAMTGIKYRINREIQKAEAETEKPSKGFQKKKAKETTMLRIQQMVKEGKTFSQIKIELNKMEQEGTIPDMGYGNKDPKSINKAYNRWLSKQA